MPSANNKLNMLLAIDIGNTHTVWGIFYNAKLIKTFRINTHRNTTEDEFALFTKNFLNLLKIKKFSQALISSVVPQNDCVIIKALIPLCEKKPLLINHKNIPVKIKYTPPEEVGADRLASALSAIKIYKLPAIIVDLGTATTFNAISENGEYLGGAIAPGLGTGANALFARAARLQAIPLALPTKIIGKNIKDSLNSGIVLGHLSMIECLVEKFQKEFKKKTSVIITGGWSKLLKPSLPKNYIYDPNLTLKGIYLTYKNLKSNC